MVAKEADELATGLAALVKAAMDALKDGWQMGEDLPALMAALVALGPAVDGLDQLDDEWAEDPQSVARVAALLVAELVPLLVKKEEPADPPPAA